MRRRIREVLSFILTVALFMGMVPIETYAAVSDVTEDLKGDVVEDLAEKPDEIIGMTGEEDTPSEDEVKPEEISGQPEDKVVPKQVDNALVSEDAAGAAISGTCGENAFWSYDESTKTLTISGNGEMDNLSSYSYQNYHSYTSYVENIVVKKGITKIGDYAFAAFTKLKSIQLPEGLTSIGKYSFYNTGISTTEADRFQVTFPSTLKDIGSHAFYVSYLSGNLILPDGLEIIDDYAFSGCTHLDGRLDLGKSLKRIGNYSFQQSKLTGNLVLPDTLEVIEHYAFTNASGFRGNLIIPDKVKAIGEGAFYECSGFNGKLTIGKRVTTLSWNASRYSMGAFQNCAGIKEVSIPIMLQSIKSGSSTFKNCSNLNKIKYAGTKEQWGRIGFTSFYNGTKYVNVADIIEYGYPYFDQVDYRAHIIAGDYGHTTTFNKINETLNLKTPCQICREAANVYAEDLTLFCTNIVHEPNEAFSQWNNRAKQAAYEAIIMATIHQTLGKQSLANMIEANTQKTNEILEAIAYGNDLDEYLNDDDFFEIIGDDDIKKSKLAQFKKDVYAQVGLTDQTDISAFENGINLGKVTLHDFVQAVVLYVDMQKTSETMDQILYQMSLTMDADQNLKNAISTIRSAMKPADFTTYIRKQLLKTRGDLAASVTNMAWNEAVVDNLIKKDPYSYILLKIYDGTCGLLNADDVETGYYQEDCMADYETVLRYTYQNVRTNYKNSTNESDKKKYGKQLVWLTDMLYTTLDIDVSYNEFLSQALVPSFHIYYTVAGKGAGWDIPENDLFGAIAKFREYANQSARFVAIDWINYLPYDFSKYPELFSEFTPFIDQVYYPDDNSWRVLQYACPVYVEVYDRNGKLAASTKDGHVTGHGAIAITQEGTTKRVWLSSKEGYVVNAVGTGHGTMDVERTDYGSGWNELRTIRYNDLPVENEQKYEISLSDNQSHALIDKENQTECTGDFDSEDVSTRHLLNIIGGTASTIRGERSAALSANTGETVQLYADSKPGYDFSYWKAVPKAAFEDTEDPLTSAVMPNGDTVITAYYDRNASKTPGEVVLSQHNAGVIKDKTINLTAQVLPDDTINKNITWSSSDQSVATVDSKGVVTGVKAGYAVITAKSSAADVSDVCAVTVYPKGTEEYLVTFHTNGGSSMNAVQLPEGSRISDEIPEKEGFEFDGWFKNESLTDKWDMVEDTVTSDTDLYAKWIGSRVRLKGISLSENEIILKKNQEKQLIPIFDPENATNKKVTWKSNATSVAVVDQTGVVKAVSEGSALISVRAEDGGASAECKVTVSADSSTDPVPNPNPSPDPDKPDSDDDIPDNAPKTGIWVKGLKQEFAYTGSQIKPEIKVYDGRTRLYENKDYTLKYKNNTKPGTAYAVLTMKGNYSGSKDVPFTIRPASLITDISADAVYTSYKKNKTQKLKPVLYVGGQKLKYGKNDLSFTYPSESVSSNSKAYSDMGTWKIHIAANNTNLFTGEQDVDLVIVNKPLMNNVSVRAAKTGLGYTGSPVTPVFTVKYKGQSLTEGADYTVIYKDAHTDIGKHSVIFKGNNRDYFGSKSFTFMISGKYDLESAKSSIEFDKASLNPDGSVPYTFGGAKPGVIVKYDGRTLTEGKDYAVSYKNNKALGTATVTLKGKGNYKGSPSKNFEIKQRDINSLSLNIADVLYSSKANAYKKTSIVFTDGDYKDQKLRKDRDYTVEYSGVSGNAPEAGSEIKVTLQGKGNYTGTNNTSFMIIDKDYDLTKAKVTVNGGKAYAYTGKAITPAKSDLQVSIKNKGSLGVEDYDIIGYYNNIKKGNSAYIRLRGKGKYSGVKMVKFKIGAAPMESEWSGVVMNLRDAFAW